MPRPICQNLVKFFCSNIIFASLNVEQIQKLLKFLDDENEQNHVVSHIQKANNNVFTHKTQQGRL